MKTKLPFNIIYLESCSSTNTLLKEENYAFNTCLVTNEQTMGRGRLSRSFISTKGLGLYFSILLDKSNYLNILNKITCLVASITRRAILKQINCEVSIKWVNDIYINNKKICGILTESKNNKLIIGIGINLYHQEFPSNINASSIEDETGIKINKDQLLKDLLEELNNIKNNQSVLMNEYIANNLVIGKRVSLLINEKEVEVRVLGINSEGELVINNNGKQEQITSAIITKVSIL